MSTICATVNTRSECDIPLHFTHYRVQAKCYPTNLPSTHASQHCSVERKRRGGGDDGGGDSFVLPQILRLLQFLLIRQQTDIYVSANGVNCAYPILHSSTTHHPGLLSTPCDTRNMQQQQQRRHHRGRGRGGNLQGADEAKTPHAATRGALIGLETGWGGCWHQ